MSPKTRFDPGGPAAPPNAPVGASADRTVTAFQVLPAEGSSSVSTEQLVRSLRAASPLEGGVTIGVAGQTTGNIDISAKLADALPLFQ